MNRSWRIVLALTERYARLAPDSIRRVANEAIDRWTDDSKGALGLVKDWSTPISLYTQVPEKMEPPIRVELREALLLRSPTVYEALGALNAFERLGRLLTNRVRLSASKS